MAVEEGLEMAEEQNDDQEGGGRVSARLTTGVAVGVGGVLGMLLRG